MQGIKLILLYSFILITIFLVKRYKIKKIYQKNIKYKRERKKIWAKNKLFINNSRKKNT